MRYGGSIRQETLLSVITLLFIMCVKNVGMMQVLLSVRIEVQAISQKCLDFLYGLIMFYQVTI